MLRRVISSVVESLAQQQESAVYPSPFNKSDTGQFAWLTTFSPCFPINASNIKILSEPKQFYDALHEGCASANRRVVLASLYLGTGSLENKLVNTLLENSNFTSGKLKVSILLDYMRGSRNQENSRTTLQPLLKANEANCTVSLYHTPAFRGFVRWIASDRWNELIGLQHMKLYIFDDTLVISGANLSNDYFTNRQDRYVVIRDRNLSNYYCGLVARVQKFSFKIDKHNKESIDEDWGQLPYEGKREKFVKKAGDLVENYLIEAREERNNHKEEGFDTWIFPMVQMGQLGVDQDAKITERLLAQAPQDATVCVASGYFNLTGRYTRTLIGQTQALCRILMAHPTANGFLGAKGVAGGIPDAYTLIARQFARKAQKVGHQSRIAMFEYLRKGWTYHGKGLWYYPPGGKHPCLTLVGSPNFGERSVKRDLETQVAIVTDNAELKAAMHEECNRLFAYGVPAETERPIRTWVHLFVVFFRNYF